MKTIGRLRAIVAAMVLAIGTGVGFCLYPAIQAAHKNAVEALPHE